MTEEQTIYRFDGFELDARRRRLLGPDGEPVELKPKSFDLLLYLVARRGEVVPKRELLAAVWPNAVVEEHSLTQAVSSLRHALGERPGEHRFIATVPGLGYCCVADFSAATEPAPKVRSAAPGTHRPVALAGTAAVAAVGLIAVGSWMMAGREGTAGAMRLVDYELLSTSPGNQTQPDLSPDGSFVAFVNDVSGEPQIWVGSVAGGEPQPITDVAGGADYPTWSPLGDEILFHALEGGIWAVGPLGTPRPRPVIDQGRNPRFSADGATIVFERGAEIWIADRDGSEPRKVPGIPDRRWAFLPAFPTLSPDGSQIAFFLQHTGPLGDLWVIPSTGGTPRRLTFDVAEMGRPAWTPDARHILVTSKRAGTRTLWRVPVAGGEPEVVTSGVGEDGDPVISRDGTRLVYTNARVATRFMVTDPATGQHETLYESRNLAWFPRVSPDGRLIAFFMELEREQIFVMNADGTDVRQLTFGDSGEVNIVPRWHPNGETLYYYENLSSRALRRVSLDDGRVADVFENFLWESNADLEWSPSGNAVAFVRIDPAGEQPPRAVVRNVATGTEKLIDSAMTGIPSWSDDGAYLLGTRHDAVLLCPVTGAACSRVVGAPDNIDAVRIWQARWSPDRTRIYYSLGAGDPTRREIWVVDRDSRNARPLFEYGPVRPIAATFEVMLDGHILWTHYDRGRTELWTASIEPAR